MFTQAELNRCEAVFDERERLQNQLNSLYCNPLARVMGFQSSKDIEVCNGWVSFTADWYGNYQAENHETFSFETSWLTKPPEELIKFFEAKKAVERQRLEEERREIIALRQSAKSKLTQEEKEALGIR